MITEYPDTVQSFSVPYHPSERKQEWLLYHIFNTCRSRQFIFGRHFYNNFHKKYGVEWETSKKYQYFNKYAWEDYYLKEEFILGKRFGRYTNYGMLDVDILSPYHPRNSIGEHDRLLASMETLGLSGRVVVVSSQNGGLHIYYPFERSVKTFTLACRILEHLSKDGFQVKPGVLEIFPNKKRNREDQYNGHRLPLQNGSVFVVDELTKETSKEYLAFDTTWREQASKQDLSFILKKPYKRESYQYDRVKEGWTSSGQSNEIFAAIACHLIQVKGITDEFEAGKVGAEFTRNVPGFYEFSSDVGKEERRCREWFRYWAKRGMKPFSGSVDRIEVVSVTTNDERRDNAFQRLYQGVQLAIEAVKESGLFKKTTELVKFLVSTCKCSISTVYKYKDLWDSLIDSGRGCVMPESIAIPSITHNQPYKGGDCLGRTGGDGVHHTAPYSLTHFESSIAQLGVLVGSEYEESQVSYQDVQHEENETEEQESKPYPKLRFEKDPEVQKLRSALFKKLPKAKYPEDKRAKRRISEEEKAFIEPGWLWDVMLTYQDWDFYLDFYVEMALLRVPVLPSPDMGRNEIMHLVQKYGWGNL